MPDERPSREILAEELAKILPQAISGDPQARSHAQALAGPLLKMPYSGTTRRPGILSLCWEKYANRPSNPQEAESKEVSKEFPVNGLARRDSVGLRARGYATWSSSVVEQVKSVSVLVSAKANIVMHWHGWLRVTISKTAKLTGAF
jgi:hypothetical protein